MTGPESDRWGRKTFIVAGMLLQGAALIAMATIGGLVAWASALIVLAIGTACVHPTLLAAVGDLADPSWRGVAVGVYRWWCDLGYVAGALLAGILADAFGIPVANNVVGVITMASGIVVAIGWRSRELVARVTAVKKASSTARGRPRFTPSRAGKASRHSSASPSSRSPRREPG